MVGPIEGYMNVYREIMNSKSFSSLDKYLENLQNQECEEILNMLGYFDFNFKTSDEELNHLAEKIGENKGKLIPFISGTLFYYFDCLDNDCYPLGYMAYLLENNSLYQGIQKDVLEFIASRAAGRKNKIKAKASGEDIKKLYSICNTNPKFSSLEYKGDNLRKILSDIPRYDVRCGLGELPQKYQRLVEKAKSFNKPILYHINITAKEEELLREASFSIMHGLYRNPVLEEFLKNGIDEGSVLFLALLCFSRNIEQNDSNFWQPFSNWIHCNDIEIQRVTKECTDKAFSRIETLRDESGRNLYVATCQMHAIVSNKRSSLEKLAQFFLKIYKRNGYITKGEWEDDIEQELLDSLTNKIVLDLPPETINAYHHNDEETMSMLMGAYSNFLKSIESIIDTGSILKNGDYIDDYLSSFLSENSAAKNAIWEKNSKKSTSRPFVYLDRLDNKIKLFIGAVDEIESPYLSVEIGGEKIETIEVVDGKTVWTKINFNPSYLGKELVFRDGDRPIYAKTISTNLVFECESGNYKQVTNLRRINGKSFIVVADEDEYISESCQASGETEETTGKPIVKGYASDDCPFIYKGQISLPKGKRIGVYNGIKGECLVNNVKYRNGDKRYKLYRSMPDFYVTLNSSQNVSDIVISVNGESFGFDFVEEHVSDGDRQITVALIKSRKQPASGTFVRLITSIHGRILFEDSFYLIKDFQYSFYGKSVFFSDKEDCEIDITYSECPNLFKGKYYSFPMKRKVKELNFTINGPNSNEKLEITPCVVRFVKPDGNDFHMNEIYSLRELFLLDQLTLTTEGHGFSLSIYDDAGVELMRLKEVSEKKWSLGAINDLADRDGLLSLCLGIDEKKRKGICKFFSKPIIMPTSSTINTFEHKGDFDLHEEGSFFSYVLYGEPGTGCSLQVESENGHIYSDELKLTIPPCKFIEDEIKINKKLLPGKYRIRMKCPIKKGFISTEYSTYSNYIKWGTCVFVSRVHKCKTCNNRIVSEKTLKNTFILFETDVNKIEKPFHTTASVGSISPEGNFEYISKNSLKVNVCYNKNINAFYITSLRNNDDSPLMYRQLTGKDSKSEVMQNTLTFERAELFKGDTI